MKKIRCVDYVVCLAIIDIVMMILAIPMMIPQRIIYQRVAILLLFSGSIYVMLRFCISIWRLNICLQTAFFYYSFRVVSTIGLFCIHILIFLFIMTMIGDALYGSTMLFSVDFPTQDKTFYVYDCLNEQNSTLITVKSGNSPFQRKIYKIDNLNQDELSINFNNGKFVFSDNNFTYYYPNVFEEAKNE